MARLTSLALILGLGAGVCIGQLRQLSFVPVASKGSTVLDRIVMISANPNLLHIYDPSTGNDTTVALAKVPLSLSVSPDGLHAAAGHEGLITWIDLASAQVISMLPISGMANNVVLGDRTVWYFSAGPNGIDLPSGVPIAVSSGAFYGTSGVLSADQASLYVSQDGLSPDNMLKVPATGQAPAISWPYSGDYPNCGPYYLSSDGSRIYTSCGTVVHSSSDPKLDMSYVRTLPVSSHPVAGIADSGSANLVAAIPSSYQLSFNLPATIDEQVQLFNTAYLTSAGAVSLIPFTLPVGTFGAHGRAVFFSRDATQLYVVVQADSTPNSANTYGVEIVNIASPPACSVSLAGATLNISSAGGPASLAVSATPDCLYNATSNAPWIVLANGAFGSGNGTLQWAVEPNPSSQPRTGTITIDGSTYTVQQSGAPASLPSAAPLSFNVVDADYSLALDRIVALSASPDQLHVYDPSTGNDVAVPLVMPPLSVSVSPDGFHAAVGHDGWISYIDLSSATVLQVYPIATDVHHVLLAGNGYLYGFPQREQSPIYSLALATGGVTGVSATNDGRIPRLEPNEKYFYLTGDGWFSKWDITRGVASIAESNFQSAPGGTIWLFEDGTHLISNDGKVYTSVDVPAQDVRYTGSFPGIVGIQWAVDSAPLQSVALIPSGPPNVPPFDTQVDFFGDESQQTTGSLALPQFLSGSSTYPGHGLFVFRNNGATALYVIERADPAAKLTATDAVYTINFASPPAGCAISILSQVPTLPSVGGPGGVPIGAGSQCPWSAASDSSWLTITAGGMGVGAAGIAWSASANTGPALRIAHISVGGQSYLVTQLGTATVPLAISPGALTFTAQWGASTGAAQSFSVTSGNGPFSVITSSGWLAANAASNGAYSVTASPAGLAAGSYVGVITVMSSDLQIQNLTVLFSVIPSLTISPSPIGFQYAQGAVPAPVTLTVADGTNSTTTFSASASYVTITPSSGTLPASIQVSPIPNLPIGTFSFYIGVSAGGQHYTVPVQIAVVGTTMAVRSVASAADFTQGPVSPGEIVVVGGSGLGPASLTVFPLTATGSLPNSYGGTSVSFDGYPAPILYTSSGAVCVVAPYEIAGQTSVSVVATYNGSATPPFSQAIAPTAPHFFTNTYMPAGQIATLNSGYSLNSAGNPSTAGSVVILYATGEGVISPPGVDGSVVGTVLTQPVANVTVTIGGQPANVLYAGGSPGLLEGVLQVNVRIPAGTPSGNVPVTMQIGANSTPFGGTIAVQ